MNWITSLFKKKPTPVPPHKAQEGGIISGLKRQITQYDNLLETKDIMIESLQSDLKEFYTHKNENRMWSLVENFLKSSNPKMAEILGNTAPQTTLGKSQEIVLNDDALIKIMATAKPHEVSYLKSLKEESLLETIKQMNPNWSKDTTLRAVEIIQQ